VNEKLKEAPARYFQRDPLLCCGLKKIIGKEDWDANRNGNF
jgi:hypothetical protein